MRVLAVVVLALVAIGAAGLWGLAQFGHPQVMVAEEHAPVAQGAAGGSVAAPSGPIAQDSQPAPAPAHANPPATLKTDKQAKPQAADAPVQTAEAAPQPEPAAPSEPAPAPAAAPDTAPAPAEPAPAEPATSPAAVAEAAEAAAKKALKDRLASARSKMTKSVAPSAQAAAPENFDASPAPAAAAAPPPPPAPAQSTAEAAPPPAAAASSAPAPKPAAPDTSPRKTPDREIVQTASAAAPAAAAPAATSLTEQFKTRKIAYNRPPNILYLDTPIDISLVIDATAAQDPAAQLQGFPGDVVKRDVDLSDTVSAQLTGVGFDIVTQTVARQSLSSKLPNRWQWRVTPTQPGSHTLMLDIFGYQAGSLDAEPLDAYRDQITVEVRQLDAVVKWAKGIQPVFAVIAAIAGALSALMAFLRFRREGRKKG